MKAFIDASVILAALGSTTGGSSEVFRLIKGHKVVGVTSQAVLEEVFRNIDKMKVSENAIKRLISSSRLEIIIAPTIEEVEKSARSINEKDAHVVASAVSSKSDYLITLDKKHLLSEKIMGLKIVNPADFLKNL